MQRAGEGRGVAPRQWRMHKALESIVRHYEPGAVRGRSIGIVGVTGRREEERGEGGGERRANREGDQKLYCIMAVTRLAWPWMPDYVGAVAVDILCRPRRRSGMTS